MTYGESNGHVIDEVILKGQTCDPDTLRAQFPKQLEMLFSYNH